MLLTVEFMQPANATVVTTCSVTCPDSVCYGLYCCVLGLHVVEIDESNEWKIEVRYELYVLCGYMIDQHDQRIVRCTGDNFIDSYHNFQ